jgi:hypothetical protein
MKGMDKLGIGEPSPSFQALFTLLGTYSYV